MQFMQDPELRRETVLLPSKAWSLSD